MIAAMVAVNFWMVSDVKQAHTGLYLLAPSNSAAYVPNVESPHREDVWRRHGTHPAPDASGVV